MRGSSTRAVRWGGWCGSLLGLALLLGCGGSETPAGEAPLPAHVRITLVDAKVGPGKSTGTEWDSNTAIPLDTLQNLASALSVVDRRAAIAEQGIAVLGMGMGGFAPPDPVGWAELVGGGQIAGVPRITLTAQEDTFTPLWNGPPSWLRAPLHPGLRVVGQILDNDGPLVSADPIGAFQISYDVLVAALRSGKVHQVQVADQTHNQLLFLGIQVWPVP